MIKKSIHPKKYRKFTWKKNIIFFCLPRKKLSSYFSNIRRTRFDQSSPVQLVSEIQKTQKISKIFFFTFFSSSFFFKKKLKNKCYPLSFSILGWCNSTRALQSAPFQNPGRVPWAWQPTDERKSSCLILDFQISPSHCFCRLACLLLCLELVLSILTITL